MEIRINSRTQAPDSFVTTILFLLSITRSKAPTPYFIPGRLYRGYVGLLWNIPRRFSLTLWIYNPQK
jgi:hypothetical protein